MVLDSDIDIAPAELPSAGLLDELRASGELRNAGFTTVGYGATRVDKTGGPNGLVFDWIRRFTGQTYKGLDGVGEVGEARTRAGKLWRQ